MVFLLFQGLRSVVFTHVPELIVPAKSGCQHGGSVQMLSFLSIAPIFTSYITEDHVLAVVRTSCCSRDGKKESGSQLANMSCVFFGVVHMKCDLA